MLCVQGLGVVQVEVMTCVHMHMHIHAYLHHTIPTHRHALAPDGAALRPVDRAARLPAQGPGACVTWVYKHVHVHVCMFVGVRGSVC